MRGKAQRDGRPAVDDDDDESISYVLTATNSHERADDTL